MKDYRKRLLALCVLGCITPSLGGCLLSLTPQQSADLASAAVVSCNSAQIAAMAAVAITADINSSQQTQKDAATAQKVTTDACTALVKLPTVIQTSPNQIVQPTSFAPPTPAPAKTS